MDTLDGVGGGHWRDDFQRRPGETTGALVDRALGAVDRVFKELPPDSYWYADGDAMPPPRKESCALGGDPLPGFERVPQPDFMTVIRQNLALRKEVNELKIQVQTLTEIIERAIDRNDLFV